LNIYLVAAVVWEDDAWQTFLKVLKLWIRMTPIRYYLDICIFETSPRRRGCARGRCGWWIIVWNLKSNDRKSMYIRDIRLFEYWITSSPRSCERTMRMAFVFVNVWIFQKRMMPLSISQTIYI
jgi:hypothetical protein